MAFEELGGGLCWPPKIWIGMFWAYFDESGEHDRETGKLTRLTLGGALAPYATWQGLAPLWNAVLADFGISMFHMADFEANEGEFEGWEKTPERRKALLASLLDLCCKIQLHIGIVANHPPEDGFSSTYRRNIVDSVWMARSKIRTLDQSPIALVYAKHPEFSFSRIEKIFGEVGAGDPRLHSCTAAVPSGVPPLQVADIIAYEISRYHRSVRRQRYPWRRLTERCHILMFTDDDPSPTSEGQLF